MLKAKDAITRLRRSDINKVRSDYMAIRDASGMSNDDLTVIELLAARYGFNNVVLGISTVLKKTFNDSADTTTHEAVAELVSDCETLSGKFDHIIKYPTDNTI